MNSSARHVVWIDDDDATDPSLTGTKFAMLAELTRWPEPLRPVVPDGFALSTTAYRRVAIHNGLDADRPSGRLLREAIVPADLRAEVHAALTLLERRAGRPGWAVRSSSPAEDGPSASYAGQFTSVLDVHGVDQVLDAYRSCCASVTAAGVDEYRRRLGPPRQEREQMAVIVQAMVHRGDGVTGVVFSEDPREPDAVLIEAVRGSGELLGRVIPDRYVVRPREGVPTVDGPAAGALTAAGAAGLGRWAVAAQDQLGTAVDVEFALDPSGRVHVLQLRPVTHSGESVRSVTAAVPPRARSTVTGLAVGSGRVEGRVCRIDGPEHIELLEEGCILVTGSTDPGWLPLLGRVGAVVTDHGGLTSHAAIVCRELGMLAVVGCGDATRLLRHGQRVVVTAASDGRGSVQQVDEH